MKPVLKKLKIANETLITYIVIFCIFLAIFFFYKSPQQIQKVSEKQHDIEKTITAIKTLESKRPLGIKEDASLEEIYNNGYMKHIRVALNGFVDGTNVGTDGEISRAPIGEMNCGFSNLDKEIYKSKFVIFNVANNEYGGVQANIAFVAEPSRLFWTWIYNIGDDKGNPKYVLRSFCENQLSEEESVTLSKVIKTHLETGGISL